MKKVIAIILIPVMFSFGEPKKFKVELTVEEWNAVYEVVDKSTAPHTQVEAVKKVIAEQINAQIKDTTIKK